MEKEQIEEQNAKSRKHTIQTLRRGIKTRQRELKRLLQLDKKDHPTNKVEGDVFYYYTPYVYGRPRVAIAAHTNTARTELYYGIAVTDSRDQFCKRTGRIRALGKAVSTKRTIVKLKDNSNKAIYTKLKDLAELAYLAAVERQKAHRPLSEFEEKVRSTSSK